MSSADIALLITAIGGSAAAIITAIAALRNANANARRVDDLIKENEKLHAENDAKTEHNQQQDAVIVDQQSELNQTRHKIDQWHEWGARVGRLMNQMQLQLGSVEAMQREQHTTAPLPMLPDPPREHDVADA